MALAAHLEKTDPEAWERQSEIALGRRDIGRIRHQLRGVNLAYLFQRHLTELTFSKRGRTDEETILRTIIRQPIFAENLMDLNAKHFAQYRDKRLRKVKAPSVA